MEREPITDLERARRSLQLENNGRLNEREVPVPAEELSAEEALEIAIEAYVYAYPLVLMDAVRNASTSTGVADGMRGSAPMNQFAHAPAFPDARFTAVVRPNVDTLASTLWFDVSKEPLVVSIPDSGGRYYQMPTLDLWTDVFASPGKRTTGTGPQRYAIVGPHWTGTLPDGVEALHAPTSLGWILGRTQADGPSDYAGAFAFQAGLRAQPLSAFERSYASSAGGVGSHTAPVGPASASTPVNQVALMDGATLFARFAGLTANNPPHINDHPQLQRMKRLGLVPGMPFVRERLSHNARMALERVTPLAQRKIRDHASRAARIVNGWVMMASPVGTYGTDFLKRALTAFLGLGTPPVEDAISPTAFATADGTPFDSEAKYEVRFTHNGVPPARALWSLTMYDDRQLFADNPIGRYALGSRDPLRYDSDGSLMLYLQRESPGRGLEMNWLPTPMEGAFTLTLRLYWPEPAALDGRWAPPLIKRVSDAHRPPRHAHGYRA